MKKILVSMFLLVFGLCLLGCDTNMTSLPEEMPDDFSFTLTFGFDGYYDSKTGILKNGYNNELECECKTILYFTEEELKGIYEIFRCYGIDRFDSELKATDQMAKPSYNIVITYFLNNKESKIIIQNGSIGLNNWSYNKKLGEAYFKIVDEYIKASEEFKLLPPNTKIYE